MLELLKNRVEPYLAERRKKGLFRNIDSASETDLIDFCSNDYLGLGQRKTSLIHEISLGGTGSRLLSGRHPIYQETERFLAKHFQGESALLFSSGYAANLGVISSLLKKEDILLYDSEIHCSIKDGGKLSGASCYLFRHNDLSHLERKLKTFSEDQKGKAIFVAIESLYSMSGTFAPVERIYDLCLKYKAILLVDEAHTTGIINDAGQGLCCSIKKIGNKVPIRIYTFGKAMGIQGACVVGPRELIDYIINFGHSFIYSTASSPYLIEQLKQNFEILKEEKLNEKLENKVLTFKSFIEKYDLASFFPYQMHEDGLSPIWGLQVGDQKYLQKLSKAFNRNRFKVFPIFSPTVRKGQERIRIIIHAFNEDQQLESLCEFLKRYIDKNPYS